MRRFVAIVVLMPLVFLMIQGTAAAAPISWTDNTYFWPGYGTAGENGTEVVGEPHISGGQVDVSGGFLVSISYNFTGWSSVGSIMKPGDLFLDTDGIPGWDYVLSLGYDNSTHQYDPTGTVMLEQINFNTAGYIITPATDSGHWAGYDVRNNTPYAYYMPSTVVHSWAGGSVSGGISSVPSSPFTYTLPPNTPLPVSGSLTFAFTENCGNDVVYETVNIPTIPEPGTILLLGTGLIGVAVFGKKKLNKK